MAISRALLSSAEIETRLSRHPNWEIRDHGLWSTFQFPDFATAWAFMQQVAVAAEALDHHPDWRNVYNRVEIKLFTHDAGGITALDFALIAAIDKVGK